MDRTCTISKSQSLDFLHPQSTKDTTMFTSTKIQSTKIKISNNNKRRKAILPTPNKPMNEQDLLIINTKNNLCNNEQIAKLKENRSQVYNKDVPCEFGNSTNGSFAHDSEAFANIDSNEDTENLAISKNSCPPNKFDAANIFDHLLSQHTKYKEVNIGNRLRKDSDEYDNPGSHSRSGDERNNETFDEFILGNFMPFTGRQNVILWLDETEMKFNRFRIVRNLRYAAIPLLVEGEARYKYMRHRREIHSFDDFYEFLLLQYEVEDNSSNSSKLHQVTDNKQCKAYTSCQVKPVDESHTATCNSSSVPNRMSKLSISNGNASANIEAANDVGEDSAAKSVVVFDSSTNSESDQTLSDLRKAIVGDLIKNPKTFKGNKDDVNKWIDEIEHLLDIAHIPNAIRLDLISYSLRDDALEWFKNNRSVFISWKVFVAELKRAFTSSFHGELAFKKLESYTQGENQSIRSFFNEVLKLCKEADATMSETTKLKTLLNKTKPTLQLEVRKKKPTSTSEFLEYAKEAEELLQLSNVDPNYSNTNNHNTKFMPSAPLQMTAPLLPTRQSFENTVNNTINRYPRYTNNDYRSSNNRNNYYRPNVSNQHFQSAPNPAQHNRNFSSNNQRRAVNDYINMNRKSFPASQTNPRPNNYSRKNAVNAIDLSSSPGYPGLLQETYTIHASDQNPQSGYQAPACPNF